MLGNVGKRPGFGDPILAVLECPEEVGLFGRMDPGTTLAGS
jgi:hypothetical protein